MLKFLLTILTISVLIAGQYLYHINHKAVGLVFKDDLIAITIYNDNIVIYNDDEDYRILNEIACYSRSACKLKVENKLDLNVIGTQKLKIIATNQCHEKTFYLNVEIKEREKEVVEKVVEKPIYIYKDENKLNVDDNQADGVEISGIKDIYISQNMNFDEFLKIISKDIRCNKNVVIDYSAVNLSKIGSYPIYYRVNDTSYNATIYVGE